MIIDNNAKKDLVMNDNDINKMEKQLTQKNTREVPDDAKQKLLIGSSESSEEDDYKTNSKY